jgi:hypothetical protein
MYYSNRNSTEFITLELGCLACSDQLLLGVLLWSHAKQALKYQQVEYTGRKILKHYDAVYFYRRIRLSTGCSIFCDGSLKNPPLKKER